MSCKLKAYRHRETCSESNEIQHPCTVETYASSRKFLEGTLLKYHEDHTPDEAAIWWVTTIWCANSFRCHQRWKSWMQKKQWIKNRKRSQSCQVCKWPTWTIPKRLSCMRRRKSTHAVFTQPGKSASRNGGRKSYCCLLQGNQDAQDKQPTECQFTLKYQWNTLQHYLIFQSHMLYWWSK